MITEVMLVALKLEGEIFKLGLKLDKTTNLHEYAALKKEIYHKQIKHKQYLNIIEEHKKSEETKRIMRKMMK